MVDVHFDGLVGPTHTFGGLAAGNLASMGSKELISSPKQAALEGLKKMEMLHSLGVKQALLPPHERPHLPTLREKGFTGSDSHILDQVYKVKPELLYSVSSASAMWVANSFTAAASADTQDQKVHLTPASLLSHLHRSIEPPFTQAVLQKIFSDKRLFTIHSPVPFPDEGAANHVRFADSLQLFVWSDSGKEQKGTFPRRQSLQASIAVAKQHQLDKGKTLFAEQNQEAIEAGVFHNDVISCGIENFFLFHEKSFEDQAQVLASLQEKADGKLILREVKEITLQEAVQSYLFNSELVQTESGIVMVLPSQCQEIPSVKAVADQLLEDPDSPIQTLLFVSLRESMRNGGGPACLQAKIPLKEEEIEAMEGRVLLDSNLINELKQWVEKHYRDRLSLNDLRDPQLLTETREALDELTQILQLGALYPFQHVS